MNADLVHNPGRLRLYGSPATVVRTPSPSASPYSTGTIPGALDRIEPGSRSKTVLIRAGIIDTFDVSRKPRLRSPETRADRPLVHRAVRYYRLSQASAWDLEPPGSTIGRDLQYGTISTVAPQQSIRASMPSIAPIVSPAAPLGTYLFWTLPETHRRHRSREYPFSDRPMCS